MPERGFDTAFWIDPFIRKLPPEGKFLFSYLWTNDHCNQAGVYQITLEIIAFETGLPLEMLPKLLDSLQPKVKWLPEEDLIWVKNFTARQQKSPKFLIAAAKCLQKIKNNGLVKEVVAYNLEHHSISIPYPYTTDSVSIPPVSVSSSKSSSVSKKRIGVVKGEGELSLEGKEIIRCLVKLKGWQADEDDVLWLQGLRSEFPGFTLAELKACVDYYSGRAPPKHKGIWKNRFRNWMIKRREFDLKGGKTSDQQPRATQERRRPITYIRGAEPVGPEAEEDLP